MDAPIEYRPIAGFPGYRVGNDGSVWSWRFRSLTPAWKPLVLGKNSMGYSMTWFYPSHKMRLVHQLVLEAFVGPRPKGMVACHNDGNPSNNAIANLRWDTPASNYQDTIRMGRTMRGEKNNRSKLTANDVKSIRVSATQGVSHYRLAAKYGVSRPNIGFIVTRKTWRHHV